MDKLMKYSEAVEKFDPVLGLQVHVELGTKTKMFDQSPNEFGGDPNTNIAPASIGVPGALPTINKTAIEWAIRLGLALNCEISEVSRFARKHYFYPDLAKAYQISQAAVAVAHNGWVDVELDDGDTFRVENERAHVEENAGKNTHIGSEDGRIQGAAYSLVDFNRSSVPLIEIVTKPIEGAGARAPEIASKYVQALRDIARALGVSEARMERGNLRADVNVSLRETPDSPLGTRTETKNVNTFRGIEKAVRYEISRQAQVLTDGGEVVQQTRHFHAEDGTTSAGRDKSDAEDYRYFPDPDLGPIVACPEWVERLRGELPELPAVRRRRLRDEWGFSELEMRDVVNAGAIDLIEDTVSAGASSTAARKWWMGELSRVAREAEVELEELAVTPAQVAELQALVDDGKINDKLARQVLEGVLAGEGDPAEVVDARGLAVVSDDGPLIAAVEAAMADNPDVVEKIRGGKMAAIGALMGPVMKATRGQADAKRVRELIMERI